MAIIGKIREKSWLLVVVVGIAMLAFVIGDMNPFGTGQQEDVYGIGTINGEKIDEEQYNTFLNNARNNILQQKLQQNPNQQPALTKADQDNAAQQAWTTSIMLNLMEKEYDALGLLVDDIELENVLYGENGFTPSSLSAQFRDSITGEFAPEQLRSALEQLQDPQVNDVMQREQMIQQYNDVIDFVRQERLEKKYMVLLNQGIHATTVEGKKEYESQKTVKNISYVYQDFTRVPNDAVGEPTDAEIKDFYEKNKNKKKFEQEATRELSYFQVPLNPSSEDTLNALDKLTQLSENFRKTKDDSSFVIRYSDLKQFSSRKEGIAKPEGAMTQGFMYPASIQNVVDSAKVGDIIGPYKSNFGPTLSKVIGRETEHTATVRHILLNAQSDAEVADAQRKADSIVRVIRAGGDFEAMVRLFSEDPGSKETGGKYEDFTEGTMVPEFNDFSFQKPIGTLGTVKTSYGIHIVEVLNRKSVEYPVFANVIKNVKVTKTTADAINGFASSLIYDLDELFTNKTLEEKIYILDTFASNRNFPTRKVSIFDENPSIGAFSDIAEGKIFRSLYDENVKAGDLISSPVRDTDFFIVGMVSKKIEAGMPKLEDIKSTIVEELKKEKRAQYLVDQMLGITDLNTLATEIGSRVNSEGVTFSATNLSVGNEPKIVGTAFSGLMDGETSVPVVGNNGVFVLRVDSTTLGEETTDYSSEKMQIKQTNVSTLNSQFQNALMEMSDIQDNRKLRNLGIR